MGPMSPPSSNRGVSLAKLAAFFAATFIISLGICGYSIHGTQQFGGTPGFVSLIGMIVSAVCLLVLGVVALIRNYRTTMPAHVRPYLYYDTAISMHHMRSPYRRQDRLRGR
jgi:hypothetical protein